MQQYEEIQKAEYRKNQETGWSADIQGSSDNQSSLTITLLNRDSLQFYIKLANGVLSDKKKTQRDNCSVNCEQSPLSCSTVQACVRVYG